MTTQHTAMSTEQVAKRLVELCREGKIVEAQEELWADDVICISPDMAGGPAISVQGKHENIEKGKEFAKQIEQHHGGHISDAIVAGRLFSISWTMDVTLAGHGRQNMEEICVYQVKEGKIVQEQYFF